MTKYETLKKELRVLLVDEHESYCELLRQSCDILNDQFDLVVHHVKTASEAVSELGNIQPNVILVDAHISDINCLDFVEQYAHGETALVVTSEEHLPSIEDSAIQRGASAYLPKTDDPDELELILEQLANISADHVMYH